MSYTPGLLVTPRTRYRVSRLLPIPGDVLVDVGDRVTAETVVASTSLPGDIYPANVAARIGVTPADLSSCLHVREGDAVVEGDLLAVSPGVFGLFKNEAAATASGTVESVSDVTGQVIVRAAPIPVQVAAYVDGEVSRVIPGQGVEITAEVAQVQGIFGVGGETHGPVRVLVESPADRVTAGDVTGEASRGAVLVVGARVSRETIEAAAKAGASAVIAGGIDDADLRDILGYDLGVAVTGTEQIGLSVVITEGFGDIAMADSTFELFRSLEGRRASVNGTTQIRAGVLRPEIVVPLDAGSRPVPPASPVPLGRGGVGDVADNATPNGATASPAPGPDGTGLAEESAVGTLANGAPLRIIRDPYFGVLGTVADLPHEPVTLESGSRARVVIVTTRDGQTVTVPRANVELIEGEQ